MAKRKQTKRAIGRKAFDKEYARVYKVPLKVAREARRLFESHTLEDATKKLLKEHPRIAKSKLGPAKAAVTRKEKEVPGGGGILPTLVREYVVYFAYKDRGSRDVIVTATSATAAYQTAWQFLRDDPKAVRMARNVPGLPLSEATANEIKRSGKIRRGDWLIGVASEGVVSETEGLAEFRNESTIKPT